MDSHWVSLFNGRDPCDLPKGPRGKTHGYTPYYDISSNLIMVPGIEGQIQVLWLCCWTCRSSFSIRVSDEWLFGKHRICSKVQDDLGSEWSCSLSSIFIAGFQILIAAVSTGTHNKNPGFCIYLRNQFEIYVFTLLRVNFLKKWNQNTKKFPLLPSLCKVHRYLSPLNLALTFALEVCCFERIEDTLLNKCRESSTADGLAAILNVFSEDGIFSTVHCETCDIIQCKDTAVNHQYFPETHLESFILSIWCIRWSSCLLGKTRQGLFCVIFICSHERGNGIIGSTLKWMFHWDSRNFFCCIIY